MVTYVWWPQDRFYDVGLLIGLADLRVYTGERVVACAECHCCLCDAAEHASIVQGQLPSI